MVSVTKKIYYLNPYFQVTETHYCKEMSNLFFDIFTSGIDFSLPGNGGPECLAHTSYTERAVESVLSVLTFSTAIIAGLKVSARLGSKNIHGLIL